MVKCALVQGGCAIFGSVSRSQMSPVNQKAFLLRDFVLSLPYGDEVLIPEPLERKGGRFGKAGGSCALCPHCMVYCLSLFRHRTGVMSMVSECAHGNWLLL